MDVIEVLTITIRVVMLQYINVSNQHVVPLKFIQCFVSSIFQLKKNWSTYHCSFDCPDELHESYSQIQIIVEIF